MPLRTAEPRHIRRAPAQAPPWELVAVLEDAANRELLHFRVAPSRFQGRRRGNSTVKNYFRNSSQKLCPLSLYLVPKGLCNRISTVGCVVFLA